MSIEYEIRFEAIWFRVVGDIEYRAGMEAFEAAVAEARGRGGRRRWPVVFDIRESREDRSADELDGIADFVVAHRDVLEPRCAVVASDDLRFGLARMFEAFAVGQAVEVTVLRSIDAVPEWLAAESDHSAAV